MRLVRSKLRLCKLTTSWVLACSTPGNGRKSLAYAPLATKNRWRPKAGVTVIQPDSVSRLEVHARTADVCRYRGGLLASVWSAAPLSQKCDKRTTVSCEVDSMKNWPSCLCPRQMGTCSTMSFSLRLQDYCFRGAAECGMPDAVFSTELVHIHHFRFV